MCRCSSEAKESSIQQHMLWIVRYAVVEVQAEASASKMMDPSTRESSEPPTSLRTNMPVAGANVSGAGGRAAARPCAGRTAEAELRGLLEHVVREVLLGVPLGRERSHFVGSKALCHAQKLELVAGQPDLACAPARERRVGRDWARCGGASTRGDERDVMSVPEYARTPGALPLRSKREASRREEEKGRSIRCRRM